MDSFDLNMKSFQKSKKGLQCLGPCFKPNTWITHPDTLEYVTTKDAPFCPTNPHIVVDPHTGKKQKLIIDECFKADENIDLNLIQLNVLSPKINFNCEQFIKIYYKIYSFENGLNWIETNKKSPHYTKIRILECMWKIYGNDLNVITNRTVNIYMNIIKKKWIKLIYKELKEYVIIDENENIYFSINEVQNKVQNKNKYRVEKINFIMDKIINHNNVYKILKKHIRNNGKIWDKIVNHNLIILNYIIDYSIQKITESI